MKKYIFLFLVLSIFGTKALAWDYDFSMKNADGVTIYYRYNINKTELYVVAGPDYIYYYRGAVNIPDSVTYGNQTYKVTRIGDGAFKECIYLTSVTIPNSVTHICTWAFKGCSGLTSVTIGNSVTSIREFAFGGCSSLTSVTIPNSVTSIDRRGFYDCLSLTSIEVESENTKYDSRDNCNAIIETNTNTLIAGCKNTVIPNSVTSIGDFAFYDCSLTSITIPNSVTSIGIEAFCNSGLTSVTIGDGVTSMEYAAFGGCKSLTSVTFGNSVKSIGPSAFQGCSSLTSVTIPNSVTSIDDSAFMSCGLTSVTFGNSLTSIGSNAFAACRSLTSVTIPNSVTSIGSNAFWDCRSLTSITIPNSVTSINSCAFEGCSALTSVTIPNSVTSIEYHVFYNCSGLISVTIPSSVTTIRECAFEGCSALTSVTIPNSVTSIGYAAFSGCDLYEVISKIENPFDIKANTFTDNTFYYATLYVPVGTIDRYKALDGWWRFAYIEEGTGGGTPIIRKCEKPTISYSKGKLTFNSATEGATYQYSITDEDIKADSGQELQLGVTYNISVYATKTGYQKSDTATATLCWIDVDPKTEGIENSIAQVRANAVLIQSESGRITVKGADDGTNVSVYNTNGVLSGTAISRNGNAVVNTNLQVGSVAVVKIGDKSVKVIIR